MDGRCLATTKSSRDRVVRERSDGQRDTIGNMRFACRTLRAGEQAVCERGVTGERRGPFVRLKTQTTTQQNLLSLRGFFNLATLSSPPTTAVALLLNCLRPPPPASAYPRALDAPLVALVLIICTRLSVSSRLTTLSRTNAFSLCLHRVTPLT
jgi:hypothetical protein